MIAAEGLTAQQYNQSPVPTNVIIVNSVGAAVFSSEELQVYITQLAEVYGTVVEVNFDAPNRRVRVVYHDADDAVLALTQLNDQMIGGEQVNLNFGVKQTVGLKTMDYLEVPALERQFLISPPASPPVGWQPSAEDPPIVNHELMAALAGIAEPHKPHVLVPAQEDAPAILVQDCSAEHDEYESKPLSAGLGIPMSTLTSTRMPPRPTHA